MPVARLVRLLWCAAVVAAALAAWGAIHLFGGRIGPWAAGLAGVAAVMAVHPAVIAIEMALSRVFGDPTPPALRLSPWAALAMYDAELDASMRGLWFATPWLWRRPAPPPAAGTVPRRLPVLFIHGYVCNRAVWLSFLHDAARRGYRCEAITLENPLASIDSHIDAVDAAIDELLATSRAAGIDATQVAVVCHSMGGLVARAALQRIDATRVAHVITLGTPHRGTLLARLGRAPSVRQMRPGSAWLAALEAREADGGGLPRAGWTSLLTFHDHVVFPQETGGLAGSHCIAIGGCGHVALLFDRRVREHVFARLDTVDADLGPRTAAAAPGYARERAGSAAAPRAS